MSERSTVERDGDQFVIRVPMKLKKRGGRTEIIVPEGLSGARPSNSRTQDPLVTAFARAFHWQELIDSGRYTTITELADALEVDRGYVSRMLRLTLLAPDIVEAVVRGEEPSALPLQRLSGRIPALFPVRLSHSQLRADYWRIYRSSHLYRTAWGPVQNRKRVVQLESGKARSGPQFA